MAIAEYWAVAGKGTPFVYIVKGKRHSESLARAMNRVNRLIYGSDFFWCETLESYLLTHKILKRNLKFCGFFPSTERDNILKIIFKPRGIND